MMIIIINHNIILYHGPMQWGTCVLVYNDEESSCTHPSPRGPHCRRRFASVIIINITRLIIFITGAAMMNTPTRTGNYNVTLFWPRETLCACVYYAYYHDARWKTAAAVAKSASSREKHAAAWKRRRKITKTIIIRPMVIVYLRGLAHRYV